MGGHNDHVFTWMDGQVVNVGTGKVAQDFPVRTSIQGDIHPHIGSQVEDVLLFRIFTDHIYRAGRNIGRDILPGSAEIGGTPDIDCRIIIPSSGLCDIDSAKIVFGCHDPGDPAHRQGFLANIFPAFSSILGPP